MVCPAVHPTAAPLAVASRRHRQNVNRKGLDAAVCLRHAGDTNIRVWLDIGRVALTNAATRVSSAILR